MINLVKPEYFIPIHGEYRHLVVHARMAEKLGLEIDAQGYLQPSRAGIYLAGGVLGTVGIILLIACANVANL
ncbi:MAG: MBL fold metallo-hydrolase RNA specificity domain-containing protein, partial [Novosphingobium sp.]